MPIVRRKTNAPVESTFGVIEHEHEFYVKPTKIQKGDVVVPAEELPDEMLRDLAKTHPREFGEAARKRGLQILEDDDDEEIALDEDEDEDEPEWTPAQLKFLEANAKDAIKLVEAAAAAQDVDAIAAYAIAEEAKATPRKSVLEALAKAVG